MPWAQVQKVSSTHPIVYSAKGSHASYATGGDHKFKVDVPHFFDQTITDKTGKGVAWKSWEHLRDVKKQAWYGYGGAWGEVGNVENTTGPQGPSAWKPGAG